MVDFTEVEEPISETAIRAIGRELGISFPEQVVQHYLQYNGGVPNPYCFITDDKVVLMVQEFLAMRYGNNTLEFTYRTLRSNEAPIPKNMIPFASDPGGNYFCFDDADGGSVHYYDGEHYDNPKRAFKRISDSLNNFLDSLEEEPEDL